MRPGMSIDELEQMHLRNLEEAANRPLVNPNNRAIVGDEVRYPHVYATKSAMAGSAMSGGKALLPLGSTRVEHEVGKIASCSRSRADLGYTLALLRSDYSHTCETSFIVYCYLTCDKTATSSCPTESAV